MANVAWIGLGVMGYPMAGHIRAKGGHELTVYNRIGREGGEVGGSARRQDGRDAGRSRQGRRVRVLLRRQRRRPARGDDRQGRRIRDDLARAPSSSTTPPPPPTSPASSMLLRARRASASSMRRSPAVRRARRTACSPSWSAAIPRRFAKAEPVITHYARMVTLIGPAGSGQLAKMVNQICIAGLVQGLSEGVALRRESRPRHPRGHGDDLQGRRRLVADGEPLEDDGRGQVRLSASPSTGCARILGICLEEARRNRRASAGHGARRPVLFRGAAHGRQTLGYVEPGEAAEACREGESLMAIGTTALYAALLALVLVVLSSCCWSRLRPFARRRQLRCGCRQTPPFASMDASTSRSGGRLRR